MKSLHHCTLTNFEARTLPGKGDCWLWTGNRSENGHPSGGLMDYTFYREIIPDVVLVGQDPPAEAVAGAIKASQDYSSGLMLAVYESGAGRFILNSLLIRENLGSNPAAGRLLRNLLNYAQTLEK